LYATSTVPGYKLRNFVEYIWTVFGRNLYCTNWDAVKNASQFPLDFLFLRTKKILRKDERISQHIPVEERCVYTKAHASKVFQPPADNEPFHQLGEA